MIALLAFLERLDALVAELGFAPSTAQIATHLDAQPSTVGSWLCRGRQAGWVETVRPSGTMLSFHSVTAEGREQLAASRASKGLTREEYRRIYRREPLATLPAATTDEGAGAPRITVDSLLTHRGETRSVQGWAMLACVHPKELLRRLREGETLAEAVEPRQPIPDPRPEPTQGRPAGVTGAALSAREGDPHFELWFPHEEPLPLDEADRLDFGGVPRAHLRSRIFNELPLAEDELTQAFMAAHPGGATLEEVGDFLGVTRERIRQIETAALDALRRRAHLGGLHHYTEDAA